MNKQNYSSVKSFYEWFNQYPLFIEIAIVIILLSVVLFIIGNVSLLFKRIFDAYHDVRIKKAKELVTAELTADLMMDDSLTDHDFDKYAIRIRELMLKNRLFKQVLIDQVIFYHRNFTDSTSRILQKLFNQLNLADSALKKLKRGAWELRAKGLKEIQEMMTGESNYVQLLNPLLNDKNNDLRIEAQAAYIRLHKENPFKFLAHTTEELLEWHQILLCEIITNTPNLEVPEFRIYLRSKNESVCSFCIKLIEYYQQLDAIPDLINLLDHPSQKIRAAAVSLLGKLDAEQAERLMIAKFPMEDLKIQLKILESVGEIGSGENLTFLQTQFLESEEFTLVKTAGCALVNYPFFDKEELIQEVNQLDDSPLARETILNHCTNVLIRN
ncbi:HEAT repeat domain-containing protein [Pedobacter polaris]|uniref:HEAT repeat domain-containing protein n=1 Tax=Pedobacter polaris TaxID=2571273 RepID=A0A4U1CU50_9SPHI|nr:HEAT repeat domain-containing protein [Pedobacter polaris]TKC12751.1 HEAT repeat domain-containing protein [Pedobacter polaris]